MMDFILTYHRYSERSILIEWPQDIDENILEDIMLFKNYLEGLGLKSIVDIISAYNSMLIIYNEAIDNINDAFLTLKRYYIKRKLGQSQTSRLWQIPVCYDESFGWDLQEISNKNMLSKGDLVRLHCQAIYRVYFIGFLPGFIYLGGLNGRLHFPRKKTPRKRIEKGAVAIGGNQTGIYPNESPAGWHVIGNCPLKLFCPSNAKPCFAKPGDRVQFYQVSKDEHQKICTAAEAGNFYIKHGVVDD